MSKLEAFANDKTNVTQKLKFEKGRNILSEKEKMLITSISFFS